MSDESARRRQLGDLLVDRGLITRAQLVETLARQEAEGSRLGEMLRAEGDVPRRELYRALADSWGVGFVDLISDPPDSELARAVGSDVMLREHWVPHRMIETVSDGDTLRTVLVATSERPSPELDATVLRALTADRVKYKVTTDWDIDQAVLLACQEEIVAEAADGLATSAPDESAATGWWGWQRAALIIAFGTLVLCGIAFPTDTLVTVLVGLNVMFLVGVVFKLAACTAGMWRVRHVERTNDPARSGQPLAVVPRIPDHDLPVYTILVPAYREANIVSKVIDNLTTLDYPLAKLQVLLLMEADDRETIEAARAARPPDCVRFVVVPKGGPQTKPKACNVGLALAEGEYLVIFDAEDMPEPGQLREVVARFAATGDDVVCFQARLNYFNATENILTRMFTLEYSFWFDYMLPGLDAWHLPIPLGGTSNHFRVDKLRDLGGWDPYNVTEDADLGVRAAARGLTVGITESTTWEEACSAWQPWVRQRTRWIKGYMTTALVHTRHPLKLWRTVGFRGVVGVIGLIAGTPAMFLACPLVWAFWLFTFLGGSFGVHLAPWVQTATTLNLILGNGAMIVLTALAARRRQASHLVPYALLTPAYWTLHSIAAWRALWQLAFKPAHWEKTPHGIVHGPPVIAR
jgi:glycosyltransferase XagB